MQQLVEMILSGSIKMPVLHPELLQLDQEVPKSDLFALLVLQRRGEASMSDLAADLGVPLSTVTGVVTRLVRKGWVERQRDERDRRAFINRLTPAGSELADRVQGYINGILLRVTSALTPEEVSILMTLVQKVLRAFQGEPLIAAPGGAEVEAGGGPVGAKSASGPGGAKSAESAAPKVRRINIED